MTTALLVYAHCDDELLWGHPWLLDQTLKKRVLICCSDRNNPARQSYSRGEEALAEVCRETGVEQVRVLSQFFSEFYRLRTRGPGNGPLLKDWWDAATLAVTELMEGCDFIATHNSYGEYGHADHLLVRRMLNEFPGQRPPLKWTTARVETSTWPIGHCSRFSGDFEIMNKADHDSFNRLKQHYVSRGCWTWSSAEPLEVSIYREG